MDIFNIDGDDDTMNISEPLPPPGWQPTPLPEDIGFQPEIQQSVDIINSGRGLKSSVWQHFTREFIKDDAGKTIGQTAICHYCEKKFSAGNGVSHLRRHFEESCPKRPKCGKDDNCKQQTLQATGGSLTNWSYNAERARSLLVDFIIIKELPLNFVEDNDFEYLVQRAYCPQMKKFSRMTGRRDVIKKFSAKCLVLKSFFACYNGKIALTSDLWTSKQMLGYMSITAHYIDSNWVLNKRLISFVMVETPHNGLVIGKAILAEIKRWGIQDKIFSISLDNAAYNDVAVNFLKGKLILPLNGMIFHTRCMCHILNIIVQKGVYRRGKKDVNNFAHCVEKVRACAINSNSHQARAQAYRNACKGVDLPHKKLPVDVSTRWNSTHHLLDVALEYRAAFDEFCGEISKCSFTMTEDDWKNIEFIKTFLKVFASATKTLSGVYYPTSCLVVKVLCLVKEKMVEYIDHPYFECSMSVMEKKFNKYFVVKQHPILFGIATILHPGQKRVWLNELICEIYVVSDATTLMSNIDYSLKLLYDEYKACVGENFEQVTESPSDKYGGTIARINKRIRSTMLTGTTSASELQHYLEGPLEDMDVDVLSWWKINQLKFPVLSAIARDTLAVPASTVASEASFSASGRVINEYRARLKPDLVECLVVLKDWDRADKRVQDVDVEKIIKEDLELAKDYASIPDFVEN